MLVLTRRVGEVVRMGDDLSVEVLAVKGNQIRLGFVAPKELPVHRDEIYQRIKKEDAGINAKAQFASNYFDDGMRALLISQNNQTSH